MKTTLTASRRSVRFETHGITQSIDLRFDGHRVWSTELPATDGTQTIRLAWPAALRPYLRGTTLLSITDSASGDEIASRVVRFGLSSTPVTVDDSEGRLLSINKWGRLGVSVSGVDNHFRNRLIAHTQEILTDLADLGYVAYITGGTLLGAVRDGDILPHDDDTDLGILLDHSDPADISLASYTLQRQLENRGYDVVRHSTAHLQLTYFTESGTIDHYVDIFTAFYRTPEEFCQPIHVRGTLPIDSLLPLTPIEFAGISMPGPANPEAWLELCYGPAWNIPNPSFAFITPLRTRRRFENWFGSHNANRVFWEAQHAAGATALTPDTKAHAQALTTVLSQLPAHSGVVDFGTGDGHDAIALAEHGHTVIGVDYSYKAITRARAAAQRQRQGQGQTPERQESTVDFRYLNIYDRRDLLAFGAELITSTTTTWNFTATHLLAGLTQEGRQNYYLFLSLVMTADSVALATFDTNYSVAHFRGDNPLTWHYPLDWLQTEIAPFGLTAEVLHTGKRRTANGRRSTATVVLRRGTKALLGTHANTAAAALPTTQTTETDQPKAAAWNE